MHKRRYQFRTSHLLLVTAVVGLTIVIAPSLRSGPIHGTSISSVLFVLLGGMLGVLCCRFLSRSSVALHQFLGGVLFALGGFGFAGVAPWPFGSRYADAYVLVCVFVGGVLGATIGGTFGKLVTSTSRPESARRGRIVKHLGLPSVTFAAGVMAFVVVMHDQPIQLSRNPSVLLMLVGGLLGTATGIRATEPRCFPQRFLGAILCSVIAYYTACMALAFRVSAHNQIVVVASVYLCGLFGGVIAGVLSMAQAQRAELFGRWDRLVWYAAVAPIVLATALATYQFAVGIRRLSDVATLDRNGFVDRGAAFRGIDPFPFLETGRAGRFFDLRTFLGLTVVKKVGLCRMGSSEYVPQELDSEGINSLGNVLPSVNHLVIHAKHLEVGSFVDELKSAKLSRLDSLQIHGSGLDDSLFSRLPPLPALEFLLLNGTGVGDAALKQVSEFDGLEVLDLSGTSVTDLSAEQIANLKCLQILSLNGTAVTDRAVPWLASLPNLQELDVRETKITNSGASRLASLSASQVQLPLQLGVVASGHLNPNTLHEWVFPFDEPGTLCVVPRADNNDFRWRVTPTSGRRGVYGHVMPDRYWLRDRHDLESWEGLEASTSHASLLRQSRLGRYVFQIWSVSSSSEYAFRLVTLNEFATDITRQLGKTIKAQFGAGDTTAAFRFDGVAGAKVEFKPLNYQGTSSGRVQLVNSRVEQLFEVPLGMDVPSVSLDSHGPFYLLVDRADPMTSYPPLHFELSLLPSDGDDGRN